MAITDKQIEEMCSSTKSPPFNLQEWLDEFVILATPVDWEDVKKKTFELNRGK